MQPDRTYPSSDGAISKTIPIWSRSIGSWKFSIGRYPYAANELADRYDKASEKWQETVASLGFDAAYANLVDQVLPEVSDVAKSGPLKVLDVGIGTGAFSTAFASNCGHRIRLTGVDVSAKMLRRAEIRLKNQNISAQLFQGDVNQLPFEDGSFDVVLVAHLLEHMACPELALAELYRVLRFGGVLIACVTRRSAVGAYIQLKWRTHRVDAETVMGWFQRCGMCDTRSIALDGRAPAGRFSNGYVGRKT